MLKNKMIPIRYAINKNILEHELIPPIVSDDNRPITATNPSIVLKPSILAKIISQL